MDITARMIAQLRQRESERSASERLFDDPHAWAFVTEEARDFTSAMEHALPSLATFVRLRTRYIDDCIKKLWTTDTQLVVLGAGADMRPYRLNLPKGTFIEIDRKNVVASKEHILFTALELDHRRVARIGADFETDSLYDRFTASPLIATKPAIFVMEGVSHYLTPETNLRMATDIVRFMKAPSKVIMYYNSQAFADDATGDAEMSRHREALGTHGFTIRSGIADIASFARTCGLRVASDVSIADIAATYAPHEPLLSPSGTHFHVAVMETHVASV